MNQPKVSVVVPIYNVEAYLGECLDSIANQSIDSLEVLLVDDGSTDGSARVAAKYLESYPNFRYFLKENGGLGDARNYGMDRATGEYICFCDSDDIIPKDAYKHMYELAKKYDCDLVTGDMERFTSARRYASSMHRISFRNECELMSIETHPELLYDATTPSKLISTCFLRKSGLRFPVGVYYEDIPFNLPIHFLASRHAHLDETVYLWRAREGESKSISQRRTEWKNFEDRFKMVKMVEEFFNSHSCGGAILQELYLRFLRIDLRIFIDTLPKADEDYRKRFMEMVRPFVQSMSDETLARLDSVDRVKYFYILKNDLDGLLKYVDYSRGVKVALPVKPVGERCYGKYRPRVPAFYADMTEEIQRDGYDISIKKCTFSNDEGLYIEGDLCFKVLSARVADDISILGYLESCVDASIICEIPAAITKSDKPGTEVKHSFKHGLLRRVRREQTRFGVSVSTEVLSALSRGRYRIRLVYRLGKLVCNRVILANPENRKIAHPLALIQGDICYSIAYNAGQQLRIQVEESDKPIINAVDISNYAIVLYSNSANVLHHAYGNSSYEDIEKAVSELDAMAFKTSLRGPVFCDIGQAILGAEPMGNGNLVFKALPLGAVSKSASYQQGIFEYHVQELSPNQLASCEGACFIGRRHGVCVEATHFSVVEDKFIVCRMDIKNDSAVQFLRNDEYLLHLRCIGENGVYRHYPVYCEQRMDKDTQPVPEGHYKYNLARNGHEGFEVNLAWGPLENSEHRRSLSRRFIFEPIYNAARYVLPIDKKMILLESYWGTKAGCNPGGLYRYIQNKHPEYKCVWSFTDERVAISGNPKKVRKGSFAYYMVIARAHYLVNNVNFENWYKKRNGQIEVQTTHGTPLKKVGLAVPEEFPTDEAREAFAKRCARWDYLVSPGPRVTEILADNYRFNKEFLNTGFPRNDILFERNSPEEIRALKNKYGVPTDKKFVLYAPTWRIQNHFELELDFTAVLESLGSSYVFGLRPHHFSEPGLDSDKLDKRVIMLLSDTPIEDCLLMADVLVTDYSSLMFDYAILGKPMLFFTYDLESYRDNLRGFNFDFEHEAPGPLLKTTEEIIKALQALEKTIVEYASAYSRFKESFCGYETGHAAERIFKEVMG